MGSPDWTHSNELRAWIECGWRMANGKSFRCFETTEEGDDEPVCEDDPDLESENDWELQEERQRTARPSNRIPVTFFAKERVNYQRLARGAVRQTSWPCHRPLKKAPRPCCLPSNFVVVRRKFASTFAINSALRVRRIPCELAAMDP